MNLADHHEVSGGEVELDILSGRPNPHWRLSADQMQRLVQAHRALRAVERRPPDAPGLGYRGFRYILDGRSWLAFAGVVSAGGATFADPQQRVERLLVGTLPAEFSALSSRVKDAIGA